MKHTFWSGIEVSLGAETGVEQSGRPLALKRQQPTKVGCADRAEPIDRCDAEPSQLIVRQIDASLPAIVLHVAEDIRELKRHAAVSGRE